jgi:hypothetical protein
MEVASVLCCEVFFLSVRLLKELLAQFPLLQFPHVFYSYFGSYTEATERSSVYQLPSYLPPDVTLPHILLSLLAMSSTEMLKR